MLFIKLHLLSHCTHVLLHHFWPVFKIFLSHSRIISCTQRKCLCCTAGAVCGKEPSRSEPVVSPRHWCNVPAAEHSACFHRCRQKYTNLPLLLLFWPFYIGRIIIPIPAVESVAFLLPIVAVFRPPSTCTSILVGHHIKFSTMTVSGSL